MGAITVPLGIVQTPNSLVAAVANGIVPCEALAVPIALSFSPTVQGLLIDLTESARKLNEIAFQGAFLDLSQAPVSINFTVALTGQMVVARAYTQGYYPLLVPMPARVIAVLATAPSVSFVATMILYNTPVSSFVWTSQ